MKKTFLPLLSPLFSLIVLFCCLSAASAQKFPKPTLEPTEPTAAQKATIQEGVQFHDQGKYAEAVKLYDEVLRENPTCLMAIYEKTLSLYYMKDFVRMVETALEGLKYKSDEIPLFLGLIANAYDDQGNPEKAVAFYNEGIKMLEGDTQFKPYLASLYYNLSVTNMRQNQAKEARVNLKKAVPLNFSYASPHYLLSNVFFQGNYKIPALLAAIRFLSLEIKTQRAQVASKIIQNVLQGGVTQGKNPNELNIGVDLNAPKDEGDFETLNLMLGISKAGTDMANEGTNKTEEEKFASQLESIIGFFEGENKLKSTFVGQNYVPFILEMKRRGYVKPFAYIVLFHTGNAAAGQWLTSNNQQAAEFLAWAKKY